jgi:hypothetical protein
VPAIHTYAAIDDCPHAHDDQSNWQESALFVWYDRDAGVGGFWRLGHEPVNSQANSCFGMFTREGERFRVNVTGVPLASTDRGETHMGLGAELRIDLDGAPRIRATFRDCEASLRFDDFHPRYAYHDLVGLESIQDSAAHHFEVAGAIRGQARVGGRTMTVNALGYRDRSWGPRTWGTLRSTRWWPCVFGPDLSLHILHCVLDSGRMFRLGYVLRNGVPQPIVDSDMAIQLESDAMTPRRGECTFRLANGETLELRSERVDGVVLHVRGYTAVEAIGEVRMGDRVGMCDMEVCTNPSGGSKPPVYSIGSCISDGFSKR